MQKNGQRQTGFLSIYDAITDYALFSSLKVISVLFDQILQQIPMWLEEMKLITHTPRW